MKHCQESQVNKTLRTHLIKQARFFKVQILWNGAAAELTTGIRPENRPGPATHKPEPHSEQQDELQHQPGIMQSSKHATNTIWRLVGFSSWGSECLRKEPTGFTSFVGPASFPREVKKN